jgi:hypothetical protein
MANLKNYLEYAIIISALAIMLGFLIVAVVSVYSWVFEKVVDLFKLKKEFIKYLWDKRRKATAKQKME